MEWLSLKPKKKEVLLEAERQEGTVPPKTIACFHQENETTTISKPRE
jgi:hypothetical protein